MSIERDNEKEDMDKPNLMTQQTKERLERSLAEIRQKLADAGRSIGEAAGSNSDWHDNAAFDYAQMEFKLLGSQEAELSRKLFNVAIIEPRQETDVVDLGNTVRLRFEDMDEDEMFTILGPDDGLTGMEYEPRWISCETPLAQAVMGKQRGETAEFNNGQIVKVKEILPGEF